MSIFRSKHIKDPNQFQYWVSGWASLLDALIIILSLGTVKGDMRYFLTIHRLENPNDHR